MIKDRLREDLKTYMKEKNKRAVNAIRLLNSEIKKKEVELMRELGDEEILDLIRKQVKMREESIEQYEKAGRMDLVEEEKEELEILKKYLPNQLTDEELEKEVKNIIEELNATKKDFGKVMKKAISKLKSVADGKRINEMVKKLLK